MFLLYKYKPVCSIHNITYWLIKNIKKNDIAINMKSILYHI
jgi:hypothetical protein